MSYSIDRLSTVVAIDPRVDVQEKAKYVILEGGSTVTSQSYTADSSSDSRISWSVTTNSPNILLDRRFLAKVSFQITITGNTQDENQGLFQTGYSAPRQFALSSVISTLSCELNNSSVSINLSDIIHPLSRYSSRRDCGFGTFSTSPNMRDYYQSYADGALTVRNCLSSFGDNSYELPRGACNMTIVQNTSTSAVVQFDCIEPLFLSPLSHQCNLTDDAFLGVQQFNIIMTLGDLSRVWSQANISGVTISSIEGEIIGQPTIMCQYITPKDTMVLPSVVNYRYENINTYITSGSLVNAGASVDLVTNNIQLQTIPERMFIFCRRRNQDLTAFTTDTFFRINSLSIQYNNVSGILSSATIEQLYNISCNNGLIMSWPEFYGTNNVFQTNSSVNRPLGGSVICLQFGQDIGLPSYLAPGCSLTQQLQINLNCTNVSAENINVSAFIVIQSAGVLTIAQNRAIYQQGVLSKLDILNSDKDQSIAYDDAIGPDMEGGSFFSSLKKGFKKIGQAAKKIPIKKILQVGSELAPALLAAAGGNFDNYSDCDIELLVKHVDCIPLLKFLQTQKGKNLPPELFRQAIADIEELPAAIYNGSNSGGVVVGGMSIGGSVYRESRNRGGKKMRAGAKLTKAQMTKMLE